MPPKKKESWMKSKGRKLLLGDVKNGAIPNTMPWQTAFQLRPEFAVGVSAAEAKRLFQNRLKSARAMISKKDARAASELALLQQDRLLHPAPATNH